MSNKSYRHAPKSVTSREAPLARDWFLRDSTWLDRCWIFAPTSALEEEDPAKIRWDFQLSEDERFTDPVHARLLECSRRLVAVIRAHSLNRGLPQRARTALLYFIRLRLLLRWMHQEGFTRFSDLDGVAVLRHRHDIASRRGRAARLLAPSTQELSMRLLVYLHRYRKEVGDGLETDPCPGQCAHALVGVPKLQSGSLPYTPDAIAVPLIQGAIEVLELSAIDILCARERYTAACHEAISQGLCWKHYRERALRAVQARPIRLSSGEKTVVDFPELSTLVSLLYAACFVVISYLVGPRASEILSLRTGSVRPIPSEQGNGRDAVAVIVGTIFKHESGYYGRTHEWVAPATAVHAISVLEALSEPHRRRSGREQLWLRSRVHHRGFFEWRPDSTARLRLASKERIYRALAHLSAWLKLPIHEGTPWTLATHQGRKTFARFVALRDRTGLFALAQHLGHRDRSVTDKGYVGNDYALHEDIEQHILEQSVTAWEEMLTAPALGGRGGAHIMARRPHFRGRRMKQDLRSFARLLVQAGLTLGVCDWGYCIYRQEHSACFGGPSGPNPIFREPSTCGRCRNFVVTGKHRPYWEGQVERHRALLDEPDLPRQTLTLARERLTRATKIVSFLDSPPKRL
jgi:integrase